VSLDSQLDRSKLERKDRDELATIVSTLGGKPGRSKKSDLVEMILELATGGTNAATAANGGRDAEGAGDSNSADTAPSTEHHGNGAEDSYGGTETRRRSRLVGWAGDEAGLPTPSE